MSLKEELANRSANTKHKLAPEKWAIMENATNELIRENYAKNALKTGDVIGDFSLPNFKNQLIQLSSILKEGNVVLSFYRGGWCPYCNMELMALQKILPEIEANRAKLIAISPELPDKTFLTIEKNKLSFEVLSDIDNTVAKTLNLVFKMPVDLQDLYQNQFNIDVQSHNGNDDFELPMTATYVINQKQEIVYDFINEYYTKRAEPSELIEVLKNIC